MGVDHFCMSSCRSGEPRTGFGGRTTGADGACYGVVLELLVEVSFVVFFEDGCEGSL